MEMSRRFFHSNSLRGVANYASERKTRHPEPQARTSPTSWIINLYLSIQDRTREVPHLLGGSGRPSNKRHGPQSVLICSRILPPRSTLCRAGSVHIRERARDTSLPANHQDRIPGSERTRF